MLGQCISAIRDSMGRIATTYEIVVVDDGSSDATASVARQNHATLIQVACRQISATRNMGAKKAKGDVFFFVDADTLLNEQVIRSAINSVDAGAVGGGCIPVFEGKLPLWWIVSYPFTAFCFRVFRQPGGSCLYCTRNAFQAIGGFSEFHFAAEDAVFVSALKKYGSFAIPKATVLTSGRNLRAHSFWRIARLLMRLAVRGPNGFRDRKGLDFWYQPKRTNK